MISSHEALISEQAYSGSSFKRGQTSSSQCNDDDDIGNDNDNDNDDDDDIGNDNDNDKTHLRTSVQWQQFQARTNVELSTQWRS